MKWIYDNTVSEFCDFISYAINVDLQYFRVFGSGGVVELDSLSVEEEEQGEQDDEKVVEGEEEEEEGEEREGKWPLVE